MLLYAYAIRGSVDDSATNFLSADVIQCYNKTNSDRAKPADYNVPTTVKESPARLTAYNAVKSLNTVAASKSLERVCHSSSQNAVLHESNL